MHDRPPSALVSYFGSRWRAEVPLGILFWRDMLLVGTLVNIVTTLCALSLLALEFSTATVLLVFFSPVPFNLFLFFSVWRTAEKASDGTATLARAGATLWLIAAVTI